MSNPRSNPPAGLNLLGVARTIGLAVFADAGTAAESNIPGDGEDLLAGAGIGLRYATPIGPVRADVGFPLDRRAGVDEAVHVYISIGQAF